MLALERKPEIQPPTPDEDLSPEAAGEKSERSPLNPMEIGIS